MFDSLPQIIETEEGETLVLARTKVKMSNGQKPAFVHLTVIDSANVTRANFVLSSGALAVLAARAKLLEDEMQCEGVTSPDSSGIIQPLQDNRLHSQSF